MPVKGKLSEWTGHGLPTGVPSLAVGVRDGCFITLNALAHGLGVYHVESRCFWIGVQAPCGKRLGSYLTFVSSEHGFELCCGIVVV